MSADSFSRPVTYRAAVPEALAGMRIDQALAQLIPALSRRRLRDILVRGGVWEGTRRLRSQSSAVQAGSELIVIHPPEFIYPIVEIAEEDVLWEDEWFVALRKQAGWYVQPTPWDLFGNLEHAAGEFLRRRMGKPVPLHLTHRLDRDTSGVIVLARNPKVNAPMQRLWSAGGVQKRYRALFLGEPPERWESQEPLGPGPNARHRVDHERGRAAHTRFVTLLRGDGAAEIQAEPLTGRTHQIRIHAAHTGHPLLGDVRYGGPDLLDGMPVPRVMLHAASLQFTHPMTGAPVVLETEPPEDYQAVRRVVAGGDRPVS